MVAKRLLLLYKVSPCLPQLDIQVHNSKQMLNTKQISFKNDILPLKNVLYRLALRIMLNREEAEDIVQETLVKIWNKRDNWQNIDSLEAFSLTICRNIALDKKRKAGSDNASIEESLIDSADTASNPYDRMLQKDRLQMVKRIVNGLPEKQRSCMQLRDFEGKSYKEIARILTLSEEQVKVNIFRARQTVKQKYQELDKYGL